MVNEAVGTARRIAATYDYRDEQGRLLFQVVRFEPKDFRQRRPSGRRGWIWNLQGVRVVPYRLKKIRSAESVYICAGEKDVHAVECLGVVATCNPMGAGKWRPEYSDYLRGKHVLILPDNDEAGRRHALAVAESLLGTASSVRIVELPAGKDGFDWVGAGGNP